MQNSIPFHEKQAKQATNSLKCFVGQVNEQKERNASPSLQKPKKKKNME